MIAESSKAVEIYVGITVASDDDNLLRSMIITTHTRLFSSFFSIYIVLISSLLCFPRPVYVLLPELLSVISYWFSKRESDGADDSYALMAYCEIMNG